MEESIVAKKLHLNYDREGDVLYISFGHPRTSDDSDVTDEGVVVRLRQGRIVGLTILNASKRIQLD